MNALKYVICAMAVISMAACKDGYIDSISSVDPGTDQKDPTINIIAPVEGYQLRVKEDVATIAVQIDAADDVEIGTVSAKLDNVEFANFNSFKDYRHFMGNFDCPNVDNGSHTLTIVVTDKTGKSVTQSHNFEKVAPYQTKYEGEMFYMNFDGDFFELVSCTNATKVKNPTIGAGKIGSGAYLGATDSYLTFPAKDNNLFTAEFSGTFWYKINSTPDRAGILSISPPRTAAPADVVTSGFRMLREGGAAGMQRFKIYVGNGTAGVWVDGGAAADIPKDDPNWHFMAFTFSASHAIMYIDGNVVKDATYTGIKWTDCTDMQIMSGAPKFIGWSHFSDLSSMDELRFYSKALTQAEIQTIMNATN